MADPRSLWRTCDVLMHVFITMNVWCRGVLWWHILSYLAMVENTLINYWSPDPDHLRRTEPRGQYFLCAKIVNRRDSFRVTHPRRHTDRYKWITLALLSMSEGNNLHFYLAKNNVVQSILVDRYIYTWVGLFSYISSFILTSCENNIPYWISVSIVASKHAVNLAHYNWGSLVLRTAVFLENCYPPVTLLTLDRTSMILVTIVSGNLTPAAHPHTWMSPCDNVLPNESNAEHDMIIIILNHFLHKSKL